VLVEAGELGVLQLHLSFGEPLLPPDLVKLVRSGTGLGLYPNGVTGVPSFRGTDWMQDPCRTCDRSAACR